MKKQLFLSLFILFCSSFLGQNLKINGLITDEGTNLGIPFATVLIKGSQEGTVADIEGKFYLKADRNDTLIISMVGYIKQEFPVNNRDFIDVIMKNEIFKITKSIQ